MLAKRPLGIAVLAAALCIGCTPGGSDSASTANAPAAKVPSSAPAPAKIDPPAPTSPKKAAPIVAEATPTPPCDAAEARKGISVFTNPKTDDAMIAAFGLAAAGLACERHGPTFKLTQAQMNPKSNPGQRRMAIANGVYRSMPLLERDCPGGEKVLKHIGQENMTGKPALVAIGKHCRFVEKGLVTQAEVENLTGGFVALVPIYRTLMTDSEIDPKVQRVLLRGLMGLRSEALPTP